MTNAKVEIRDVLAHHLRELLEDLREDHEFMGSTCDKGCKRYACTHTFGGYEAGSAAWKVRVNGMRALEEILNAIPPRLPGVDTDSDNSSDSSKGAK